MMMQRACRYALALAFAGLIPVSALAQSQPQQNPGGIARPTTPRPPLVESPADLAEPAQQQRPRAQSPSLWQAGQRREAAQPQPQSQQAAPQTGPQPAPVAGPAPANGAPMTITPPGQRAPIRPEMNANSRDLPSYRPPPPSYLPPKNGVVANPPSTRPPPPIMRQTPQAPAMMRQPGAPAQRQPAARTATTPQTPPPGFRPVPPRAPAFRPIGPVARPGSPTQPAPQQTRQQTVQCTPQMVAARMCRP
jgi:hypothetical protein